MAITKITTPELFDFSSLNTALQLPTGPTSGTGGRPSNPSTGEWRYNTTLKYVEYYDGADWFQIDTEAIANPDDFPSENFNVNTYFGNGGTQTIDAKFNEAANFNGSSSFIEISQTLLGSGALKTWSTSFWFKTSSSNEQYLNNTAAAGSNSGYSVYIQSTGYLIFTTSSGAGGTSEKGLKYETDLSDGNWHNVVATYTSAGGTNDATLKIYVDGADVTSSSVAVNGYVAGSGSTYNSYTIPKIVLGRWADTGSAIAVMQGAIDQVRFFNTALTDAQAIDCYTDETTTTAATLNFPAGAGCIAAYQLDGDASDLSGTYGGVTTDIGYTGLRFQPDFVWIKRRNATLWHNLFDTVRGKSERLFSNSTTAESFNNQSLTEFESNGFSVGTDADLNVGEVVAWCWKAGGAPTATNSEAAGAAPTPDSVLIDGVSSTAALAGATPATNISANTGSGFSIVKYTGPASNSTIAHGLGVSPSMIIQKPLGTGSWYVYIAPGIIDATSNYYYLVLDSSAIKGTTGSAAPTTTTINSAGTGAIIAYCFADIAGYQRVGSYTGSGADTGNYVYTDSNGDGTGTGAFEPAFLLVKRTDVVADWFIYDNKRIYGSEAPANPLTGELRPNRDLPEDDYPGFNFYTNGFEVANAGTNMNASGGNYIYLAIAADKDTSVPTVTNSFSPTLYSGTNAIQSKSLSFKPDFIWFKNALGTNWHALVNSVSTARTYLFSNSTALKNDGSTSTAGNDLASFDPNGFTVGPGQVASSTNDTGTNNTIAWAWKAGGLPTLNSDGNITSIVSANQAAGMSIVEYTTAGSKTIGHGLLQAPELIIQKRIDVTSLWVTYTATTGLQNYLQLQDLATVTPDANFMTAVGTSTFTSQWSSNNHNYINYCFHSVAGYQKVGSYTWTGTSYTAGTMVTGLGFTPSFVMIKGTDVASNWSMYDNKRVSGTQSFRLAANSSEVEDQVGYQGIIIDSDGFSAGAGADGNVTGSSGLNENGKTYIYLAIG